MTPAFQLALAASGIAPDTVGQDLFTTPGVFNYVVRPGVTRLPVFGQGGGGASGKKRNGLDQTEPAGAGGSGGTVFATLIVTPGETLEFTIPAGGSVSANPARPLNAVGGDGEKFMVRRGATVLLEAYGGQGGRTGYAPNWAAGGSFYMNMTYIDAGYPYGGADGGRGGYGSPADGDGGGGGPGGFSGTGGDGAVYPGQPAGAPTAASGGASGGNGGYGGGGIELLGKGATASAPAIGNNPGLGGSGGANAVGGLGGLYGAGGAGEQPGRQGAARVIYGAGRYYPDTNTADARLKTNLEFAAGMFKAMSARFPLWTSIIGATFSRTGAKTIRDSAGSVTTVATGVLARSDKGVLIEPARTNKALGPNANPTTTAGITTYGDAARVFSLVSDTAALAAAGLSSICTSGNVFKLDNSAGTTPAYAVMNGLSGNNNQHIQSIYARGSGSFSVGLDAGVDSGGIGTTALTAAYARRAGVAGTLPTSTANLRVAANAGAIVYFILWQLEEGSEASSPIVVTGASATRGADTLTQPHVLPSGDFDVEVAWSQDVTPGGTVRVVEFHDGTDNNRLYILNNAGVVSASVTNGGVTTQIGSNATGKTGAREIAAVVRRRGGNWILEVDGTQAGTATAAAQPVVTTLENGRRRTGAEHLGGYLRTVKVTPV